MGNDLTFVSLSGNLARDTRETNKVVRAHVMRRYKRQQRRKSPSHTEQEGTRIPTEEPTPGAQSSGSCELSTASTTSHGDWDSRSDSTAPSRGPYSFPLSDSEEHEDPENITAQCCQYTTPHYTRTWLGSQRDPFTCLPILVNPRMLMLLQHRKRSSLSSQYTIHMHNFRLMRVELSLNHTISRRSNAHSDFSPLRSKLPIRNHMQQRPSLVVHAPVSRCLSLLEDIV